MSQSQSTNALSYIAVLSSENVLTITANRLDPDVLMDKLGLSDEAKIWADVFHEVLAESGALEQYATYLARPDPITAAIPPI